MSWLPFLLQSAKNPNKNSTFRIPTSAFEPASLPRTREADIIGRQLLKAGTSVGANYREANRARSKAEFRAKIGIVEQESDESLYWLELLKESGIAKGGLLEELLVEADELVAIFTTIGKKSK